MKKLTLALLLIFSCATAWAADFDKGLAAYEAGDFATTLTEWKPLAEQGDAGAQYYLGLTYGKGEGVIEDYKEAVKWCRLAAEQGHPKAQAMLGAMYAEGRGVIQDNVYAHMWLNIAAVNGLEEALKFKEELTELPPEEISSLPYLTSNCIENNYKDC